MSPYRSASTYMRGYAPRAAPPAYGPAEIARILYARRALIAKIALSVILLATIIAFVLPRQYSSSSVVMLDQRKNNITDLSAVLSQLPADPATLQNQIQIITSRELASDVIARLKLYDDPEFNPALVPVGPSGIFRWDFWFPPSATDQTAAHDRILASFLRHVSAEANGLSTAITIYASASKPEKAQAIANAVAQAYVNDQVDVKRKANLGTSDWLDKRTNDLAQQLMMEQQAVEQYKVTHGLNDAAPGNSLVDQQLTAINAQIVQTKSTLAEKEAQYDRVGASAQTGDAEAVSQVVASPLIVQLRGQQAELMRQEADFTTRYGPLHPKLLAVQAQLKDLNAKIGQEASRIADSLKNDVEATKAHLESLEESLSETEHQANGQNQSRVQLQALQSNADATKAQYEAFVGRLRATEDQDSVAAPESRIISSAILPLAASAPQRGLIIAASIPLGVLLGILAALLTERFGPLLPALLKGHAILLPARRGKPQTGRQPSRPAMQPGMQSSAAAAAAARAIPLALPAPWNGPPILAELANAEKLGAASYVVDYPGSRYAETMAALVGQLDVKEGAGAVVAITAAQGGESKSAIAVSIARAAAQMGRKTVLVDCDPGQLASQVMESRSKAGLYEVLTGSVTLSQALSKDSRTGVYTLSMSRRPPKLSTMFSSAAMSRLIEVLKEGADLVVMDCSRAAAPEANMLARLGDATLLVTRKELLNRPGLDRSLAALTGCAPLAIIATK